MNRCRLLLPITGVTSVKGKGSKTGLFDYSSPPPVGQLSDDG
jgi:hypothetical protein